MEIIDSIRKYIQRNLASIDFGQRYKENLLWSRPNFRAKL